MNNKKKNKVEEIKRGKPFVKVDTASIAIAQDEALDLAQERKQTLMEYSTFFNTLKKSLSVGSIADRERYYSNYMRYNYIFLPLFAIIMFFDKSLLSFSFMSISLVKSKMSNRELNTILRENPSFGQLMAKKFYLATIPLRYCFFLKNKIKEITCIND